MSETTADNRIHTSPDGARTIAIPLAEKFQQEGEQPITKDKLKKRLVKAAAGWDIYRGFMNQRLDPDPIKRLSRANGIATYADMGLDAKISSCKMRRKRAVAARQSTVVGASEDAIDVMVKNYVVDSLKRLKDLRNTIMGFQDAPFMGYVGFEYGWEPASEFPLTKLYSVVPQVFDWDETRTLLYRPDWNAKPLVAPPNQFLIYTHNPMYENPFGTSDLQPVYWPWWFKKNTVRFYVSYLDKYAQPFVLITLPAGTDEDVRDDLLDIAESISTEMAATIETGQTFEYLEAERGSAGNAYHDSFNFFNSEIVSCLLGHSAQTDRTDTGSYGEAEITMLPVAADIAESDMNVTETIMNDMIIPLLVDLRFGPETAKPKFQIVRKQPENLLDIATWIDTLVKNKLRVGVDYVYGKFGIPKPPAGAEVLAESPAFEETGDENGNTQPREPLRITARDISRMIEDAVKKYGVLPHRSPEDAAKLRDAALRAADADVKKFLEEDLVE